MLCLNWICLIASHDLSVYVQACKIVLQLRGTVEGVKGYNELCRAVVVLMSCSIDYAKQIEGLPDRVLVSLQLWKQWD